MSAIAISNSCLRVLFGVSPLDPLTLLAVSFLLIVTSPLACYVPARRAARSDPNIALRYESVDAGCDYQERLATLPARYAIYLISPRFRW